MRFAPRRAGQMRRGLACGLGLVVLCPPLAAQEEVVVTGERLPERTSLDRITTDTVDTPQAISTVTAEELERRGVDTLADALRVVPGISLGAGETSWQGNNLVLRGFTTRNDTFLDGMRDYGYYYRDPFASERIEVLKGPGSTLFGRGATGGAINQASREPVLDPLAGATAVLGSDHTRRATLDLGMPLGGSAALRVAAMAHRSEVAGRDGALDRRWGVAPSFAAGIGTPTRLTLSYFRQSEDNRPDYGIPWFAGAPARVDRRSFYGFADDYLRTDVDILTARLEHDVSAGVTLRGRLRYSSSRRSFRTSEAVIPVPPGTPLETIAVTRNEFSGYSDDRFAQGQAELTARLVTGGLAHTLVAGIEAGREMPEPSYVFHVGVVGTRLVDPLPQAFAQTGEYLRLRAGTRANSLGVFLLDTIALGPSWLLIGGLRWDRFDADYRSTGYDPAGTVAATTAIRRTDARLSPRAAIVYKPGAASSLYASFATSFNPSAEGIESLISSGRSVAQANLNADPETGRILEAGGKWQAAPGLLLTASAFEIVKSNVRIPDPAVANANTNGGTQRVRGLELEAVGSLTPRWSIRASYALLDTATTRSDNPAAPGSPRLDAPLTIAPRHSASIGLDHRVTDRLSLGGGLLYQSSRLGQNTNASLLRAPGYAVVELRGRYEVADGIALQANLSNAFDTLYYDQLHPFHVVPGAGRSVSIALIVRR
ncbi:MAG: TonB-dependent siderophore receptor [Sphingomonas sp.]